jgi:Ca2+-binding RTX toxin-like protein
MRRITLLLMLMAIGLLAVSGVAWAITKSCPPEPKICYGTNGSDVLKNTSAFNIMAGKAGNDTYTNFLKSNAGKDTIGDSAGNDTLQLTQYSQSQLKLYWVDANNNGKADTAVITLGSQKNWVRLLAYFDDTRSKPPFRPGNGYIENIKCKGC